MIKDDLKIGTTYKIWWEPPELHVKKSRSRQVPLKLVRLTPYFAVFERTCKKSVLSDKPAKYEVSFTYWDLERRLKHSGKEQL